MTTSNESTGPQIPDFEKDAQSIAAYEEAKTRYERREVSDAESKTRSSFTKKRDAIRAEIAVAASLLEERRNKAQRALSSYAARYPHRVDRNRPVGPSFWENVFSMGSAGRIYNRAVNTANDAQQAQTLRRRKEHDEEELEQQLKRSLYLQEDSIKKKLESAEGLTSFHSRPGIGVLYKRVEEIKLERASYQARLEKGAVPAPEQRDREFAERKIEQLEAPFASVTTVRIARYGDTTYFILRDLEKRLYHLSYDPRLEPLIDSVYDVYRIADSFEARLTRGQDGRPLQQLDHFMATIKDEELARSEARRTRTAMRAPRTELTAMSPADPNEAALLEVLANFARTVGPGATMFGAGGVNVPPSE